jgi:hypothetical protein
MTGQARTADAETLRVLAGYCADYGLKLGDVMRRNNLVIREIDPPTDIEWE